MASHLPTKQAIRFTSNATRWLAEPFYNDCALIMTHSGNFIKLELDDMGKS